MIRDRRRAGAILRANEAWFTPGFEVSLDAMEWGVWDGMLVMLHPSTSVTTWLVHIASEPGTTPQRVVAGCRAALAWFAGAHPEVKKLLAFIRADNVRTMKMAAFMGFLPEGNGTVAGGMIRDYLYQNGRFYDIIIMGRRQ